MASVIGLPLPLLPLQLLWINLVTDGLPALALVMDPADPSVLERPPRPVNEPMLGRPQWLTVVLIGVMEAGLALSIYWWALSNRDVLEARSLAFSTLVFCEVLRAFAARSQTRVHWELGPFSNWRLVAVVVVSILVQLAIPHLDFAQRLFEIGHIPGLDNLLALGVGLIPVSVLEIRKLLLRRHTHAGARDQHPHEPVRAL